MTLRLALSTRRKVFFGDGRHKPIRMTNATAVPKMLMAGSQIPGATGWLATTTNIQKIARSRPARSQNGPSPSMPKPTAMTPIHRICRAGTAVS